MIEIKNLSKTFINGNDKIEVLKNISLTIEDGDIYGIIGMSGAGKSTLVRCINLLETPTNGEVIIDGENINNLPKKELRKRRQKITMIFQGFNLLMQRTCLENVAFPLKLLHVNKKEREKKALELLDVVGLKDKANVYPATLSGGQHLRVAIARALATNPKILLCDEATSALDPKTTKSILQLLKQINKEFKVTIVIITHQMSVVEEVCNKVAILEDGVVAEKGDVNEIFSMPKSKIGKKLVYPEIEGEYEVNNSSYRRIRIVYNGAKATSTPLITKLALDKKVYANIIYASTKVIQEKMFGNMILGIPLESDFDDVINYLKEQENVYVEEVSDDELFSEHN